MDAHRRLLVVVLGDGLADEARAKVEELGGSSADVRVVAPAAKLSRLQWLMNEEDEARERAGRLADRAAAAVEPDADDVEREVGDVDPLLATEDALRTFDADEIVVVCPPPDRAEWLEQASLDDGFERFGLPVEYIGLP